MENLNFQQIAGEQGRIGEDLARIRVEDAGFHIDSIRGSLPGVEVDIIATNKQGITFFFTVKASWRGDRQGLKRTDTLKKAICDCFLIYLNTGCPGIIITSHKPTQGRGKEMLEIVPPNILFEVIELNNNSKRLRWLANATEDDLWQWEEKQMRVNHAD